MNLFPDDRKHPSGGERIDQGATDAIRLAHRALERFPDLVRKHKFLAGGAAISSSLVVLAGVALTRRIRSGQTREEAVASVTEEELEGLVPLDIDPDAEARSRGARGRNGQQAGARDARPGSEARRTRAG